MDVHKASVLSVFDAKQRLEVPLFQRQYVWDEEHQWLPLWEDIERKFTEVLEGHQKTPTHCSIGCAPCTRAVGDGAPPRSGRWAGLDKSECGIHLGPNGRFVRTSHVAK